MLRTGARSQPTAAGRPTGPPAAPEPGDPLGRLRGLCAGSGLQIADEVLVRLGRYLDAMLAANRHLNLSGIRDHDEALVLHVLDSLQVHATLLRSPRLVLDLGTGNGFPGVASAALWPEARVVLVERTRKKADAVAACLAAAELAAEVLPLDAAQLPGLRPELRRQADLVLSRATASLVAIARLAVPLMCPEGLLVQWKAAAIDPAERGDYEQGLARLGLLPRADLVYVLPTPEPRPRRLVTALRR